MAFARSDLADFTYFLAIARHRNFRRAATELGLSPSALSHSLKGLEARLGVRLLNRTNRSVTLTAAGEELQAEIVTPFEQISHAVENLNRFRDDPAGRVKLNVGLEAASLLLAPVIPVFAERYPDIELEISASNRMLDVTDQGFDAGIRFGGTVPMDMIAQRLSPDIRWVVVGAPTYLERHGIPRIPQDLSKHRCIRMRLGNDKIYQWEFERGTEDVVIAVSGFLIVDHAETGLKAALDGVGLIYLPEPLVRREILEERLSVVLSDWAPVGPGFHIYYSSRRHVPTGLRLFIDLLRELKPLGA